MRFHEEASRSHYDAVVVGSGLGGLTSAALLARAGKRVLIVERTTARATMRTLSGAAATASIGRAPRLRLRAVPSRPMPAARLLNALGCADRSTSTRRSCYRVEWPGPQLTRLAAGAVRRGNTRALPPPGEGDPRLPRDCLRSRRASRAEAGETPFVRPSGSAGLRFGAPLFAVLEGGRRRVPQARAIAALCPIWFLPPRAVVPVLRSMLTILRVRRRVLLYRGVPEARRRAGAAAVGAGGECSEAQSAVRSLNGRRGLCSITPGVRAPVVISNAMRQTVEGCGADTSPRYLARLHAARPRLGVSWSTPPPARPLPGRSRHEPFSSGPRPRPAHASGLHGEPSWPLAPVPTLVAASPRRSVRLVVLTTLVAAHQSAAGPSSMSPVGRCSCARSGAFRTARVAALGGAARRSDAR